MLLAGATGVDLARSKQDLLLGLAQLHRCTAEGGIWGGMNPVYLVPKLVICGLEHLELTAHQVLRWRDKLADAHLLIVNEMKHWMCAVKIGTFSAQGKGSE